MRKIAVIGDFCRHVKIQTDRIILASLILLIKTYFLNILLFHVPERGVYFSANMTALSLLFMAVSVALITAESNVYFREQFEDGGKVIIIMLFE